MIRPRTSSHRSRSLALIAGLALLAGCGGSPSEVDTADTIPTDPAKSATPPATPPPPASAPAKEAPKG